MPRRFKKRVSYRRRRAGGRQATPWYNKKYSPMEIASKALAGVNYVRGLVNSEKYKFDTSIAWTPTNVGQISCISLVAQGDGDGARTGNSIFCRQLNIQGNATRNSLGTYPDGQIIRLMVVIDTQQVGDTSPSISDVVEANGVNSFLNSETVGRFTVLWSKRIMLDTQHPNTLLSFNHSMKHHIRFNGTAGSDVQKGALYVLAFSNETTNAPTIGLQCRLSYHDN